MCGLTKVTYQRKKKLLQRCDFAGTLSINSYIIEPTTVELNPYLEPVHKRKVNAPATLKVKPAAAVHLPAVQVADAGASYNPTMEDHQALLRKAHQVEEDKIAERERINKQLEFRKELLEMDDDEVAKTDDEEEEDSDVHSDDDEETRKRKEIRKKTRTERNRLRRAKENKWLEDRRRREKALNKELHKLDEIQQMVVDIEQETEEKTKQRQERQEAKEKAGLPRLGKYYVPKVPIEVQLTEELSESLRTLKVRVFLKKLAGCMTLKHCCDLFNDNLSNVTLIS